MSKKYDIGVIIGRFQVHKLHEGHKKLIETVLKNHKKTIVVLGCTDVLGGPRNPLDFVSRKMMIEESYPEISAVIPHKDQVSDTLWSSKLDEKIKEVYNKGSVLLYGSRDSFIPHYKGKFDVRELEATTYHSGTEIRHDVAAETKSSELFRAGVIYGLANTYPFPYSTVDVAIRMNDGRYLMAKKPNEEKYRFVGGFVDVDDTTDQAACRREVHEEVKVNVDGIEYISSRKINDWRYRGEPERGIMTRFFHSTYTYGRVVPGDYISESKYMSLDEMEESTIVENHLILVKDLKSYVKKKKL
jgi:bifunctional NMN adenylyltransferase/nudix hydrolase